MAYHIDRDRFRQLAEQALRCLPDEFLSRLSNITVDIEGLPGDDDVRLTGVPREELLGLFRGIGYPDKAGFFDIPQQMPDRIVLFQQNIEDICSSEGELEREIEVTLFHEIGHYLGLDEDDLHRYGY